MNITAKYTKADNGIIKNNLKFVNSIKNPIVMAAMIGFPKILRKLNVYKYFETYLKYKINKNISVMKVAIAAPTKPIWLFRPGVPSM